MEKSGAVWVAWSILRWTRFRLIGSGHCFLMMEDLQQAYAAYKQALYHLRDPKVRS